MLILLRNNHPLLRHPDPRSQLATAQWVLPRANAPARNLLDKAFVTLGLPLPQPTVETGMRRWCEDCCRAPTCWRRSPPARCVLKRQWAAQRVAGSPARYHPAYRADVRAGSLPSPATQALLRFIYQQVQDGAV